jgi:RNA polymerase sigma-70 factor (ECF subfamily)
LDDSIEIVDPRSQEAVLSIYDRVALQQAISQLTLDQQQVLTLKFFGDMTNNEIATLIGRSEGAVKALQHRALQSLQQIMAREARDTALLAKEYGTDSESWSAWDEPIKSRSLSIDD